jgi:hypothetical protein
MAESENTEGLPAWFYALKKAIEEEQRQNQAPSPSDSQSIEHSRNDASSMRLSRVAKNLNKHPEGESSDPPRTSNREAGRGD